MAETQKIEERTLLFIKEYGRLKASDEMPTHEKLAEIIGVKRKQNITEILKKRQNIQPDQWKKFKDHFKIKEVQKGTEIREEAEMKNGKEPDYKLEYLALLKNDNKNNEEKINKLMTAVEKIVVVDQKIDNIKSTVDDLKDKFSKYVPTIEGLQEFVIEEIAGLKRKSRESVGASLNIKVEAHRKKAAQ